jgi:threonine dehydratase
MSRRADDLTKPSISSGGESQFVPGPRWDPVPLGEVEAARERIAEVALRTPLVRLDAGDLLPSGTEVYLKLECLQPVRSFKLRGAYNAISARQEREALTEVTTLSAGNMSQAVAWSARRLELRATAIMPDTAPEFKKQATRGYGAEIELIPRAEVMTAMQDGRYNDRPGFIHPFNDPLVAAGNGTIGLEIIEDMPDVDTIIVPVGGGGLVLGIACAVRAARPATRIYGVQPLGGSALAASLEAGKPMETSYDTFVDGAGAPFVVDQFFPDFQHLLAGCLTPTDDETKAAMYRLAMKNKLVTEGAGALAVAAALALPHAERGRTVCIVSGGSLDPSQLAEILLQFH